MKPAPDLPNIMGDIGQLEQMVMNLVVNAQNAMPDGGLLSIETSKVTPENEDAAIRRDLAEGTYILFAVSDTDSGMAPETRKHIFGPFFQPRGKWPPVWVSPRPTVSSSSTGQYLGLQRPRAGHHI